MPRCTKLDAEFFGYTHIGQHLTQVQVAKWETGGGKLIVQVQGPYWSQEEARRPSAAFPTIC